MTHDPRMLPADLPVPTDDGACDHLPTTASATVKIAAPPATVYGLIADVTNMGRWSPECRSCEWLDEPCAVGSRFRGHNSRGPVRWSTVAEVLVADPGREFAFATMHGDQVATRWIYRMQGVDTTTLTESFEAVHAPRLIALAERWLIRDRQQQLEKGMASTLTAIKAAAEGEAR